jgi:hypothetical protein
VRKKIERERNKNKRNPKLEEKAIKNLSTTLPLQSSPPKTTDNHHESFSCL